MSNMETNPKEHVKAVTLRSGKELNDLQKKEKPNHEYVVVEKGLKKKQGSNRVVP